MRLIEIRKILKEKEEQNVEDMDDLNNHYSEIKNKLDQLLIDVIGVPEEGQHQINEILQKAIKGDIREKTAVVAIHEIFKDYCDSKGNNEEITDNNENTNKTNKTNKTDKKVSPEGSELQELYRSGYR